MPEKIITPEFIAKIRQKYKLDWHGLHGISHWSRVRRIGLKLCESTTANTKVIEMFAFLHDACRLKEGCDLGHGSRASVFAGEINSLFHVLNKAELLDLQLACEFHTCGFTAGYSTTVLTCWDADRLDLGRVGQIPDPQYLCTEIAKQDKIIAWAYQSSIALPVHKHERKNI